MKITGTATSSEPLGTSHFPPKQIYLLKLGLGAIRAVGNILKETYLGWAQSNGRLLAAALSYYTIFSVTPLLVMSVSIAGIVFSETAVTARLVTEVETVISPTAARAIQSLLENNHLLRGRGLAATLGAAGMLWAASLIFAQLKRAINLMWGIAPHPEKGLFVFVRTHFLSFVMVFVVILMLLGMMFASTLLVSLNERFVLLPQALEGRWPEADFGLTFIGFAVLFTIIFKTLPDAHTAWRDVLIGAAATSLLFTIGGFLLGYYLGNVNLYNVYGAASSVFLIMVWIYYSMQIILFGAKLTQVIANRYGSPVVPSRSGARIVHRLEVCDSKTAPVINDKYRE